MNPIISVIIPVYKVEAYLHKCVTIIFYIAISNFFICGLKVIILTLTYIILMWFMALRNNEKEIFKSVVRRLTNSKK